MSIRCCGMYNSQAKSSTCPCNAWLEDMWDLHLEHLPACCKVTVEGSTRCPSPLLPLTSASETGNPPAPSPFLGAVFPNFPRPSPHLPQGIHCRNLLKTCMGLGTGTCVLPLHSLAPTGEPVAPYLQFNICVAPEAGGSPQQGPSNTQRELAKSSLVRPAAGRG